LYSPLFGLDIASDAATAIDLQQDPDFEYGLLPLAGEVAIGEEQRQWESGDPRFGPVGDSSTPRLAPPPLPWRDC
jgi:hypothetical protein